MIGLAHVATVSFLASRAAPSLQFFFALGGGVSLARASFAAGARAGHGASLAAMLQTVAVMGPARVNAPLTQAITAPMMGRLQARGAGVVPEFLACLALRLVHYAVVLAAFVWIILGGLDEYVDSFETLTSWLGVVPQGKAAAITFMLAGQVGWAVFFSTVQVMAYRRALRSWPEPPAFAPPVAPAFQRERGSERFDPRAIVAAAVVATVLLLANHSWLLLLGVTLWLIPAWALSRPDREAVPLGLALAGLLAFAALTGGLLVAVATWMRAAAGPGGLREVFRRMLERLRWIPSVPEAIAVLGGLDAGSRLIAAGRAAASRFADVDLKPAALADTLAAWVAEESVAYAPGNAPAAVRLRLRAVDGLLVALTLAPALATPGSRCP